MQKLLEFISSHWDSLVSYAGAIAGIGGWLSERKKRIRDNRDSDVAFWEKTIDRQNVEIAKLVEKVESMQAKYEEKIQQLQGEIAKLSGKLAAYESHNKIHTL